MILLSWNGIISSNLNQYMNEIDVLLKVFVSSNPLNPLSKMWKMEITKIYSHFFWQNIREINGFTNKITK